jgi:hypothetical protein
MHGSLLQLAGFWSASEAGWCEHATCRRVQRPATRLAGAREPGISNSKFYSTPYIIVELLNRRRPAPPALPPQGAGSPDRHPQGASAAAGRRRAGGGRGRHLRASAAAHGGVPQRRRGGVGGRGAVAAGLHRWARAWLGRCAGCPARVPVLLRAAAAPASWGTAGVWVQASPRRSGARLGGCCSSRCSSRAPQSTVDTIRTLGS